MSYYDNCSESASWVPSPLSDHIIVYKFINVRSSHVLHVLKGLSAAVANMLDEQGLDSTRSLRVFIRKIRKKKFSDCQNVGERCNTTRKAELNPYLSEDDPRLEVINLFGSYIRG